MTIFYQPVLDDLRAMADIVWIEIGVWKGVSTKFVLNSFDIKKIYLIDPYVPLDFLPQYFGTKEMVDKSRNEAHVNLKAFHDKIVWLQDFSQNVSGKIPDEIADVLYIDGEHSYEAVLQDLNLYVPKLKKNGIVIGDDYKIPGVKKAIEEYASLHNIQYDTYIAKEANKKLLFWFRK